MRNLTAIQIWNRLIIVTFQGVMKGFKIETMNLSMNLNYFVVKHFLKVTEINFQLKIHAQLNNFSANLMNVFTINMFVMVKMTVAMVKMKLIV